MDSILIGIVSAVAGSLIGIGATLLAKRTDPNTEPGPVSEERGARSGHTHFYNTMASDGNWLCGFKGPSGKLCGKKRIINRG